VVGVVGAVGSVAPGVVGVVGAVGSVAPGVVGVVGAVGSVAPGVVGVVGAVGSVAPGVVGVVGVLGIVGSLGLGDWAIQLLETVALDLDCRCSLGCWVKSGVAADWLKVVPRSCWMAGLA
jgi:hypothetical protein